MSASFHQESLTDRQAREVEYHRDHAKKVSERPLWLDIIEPGRRKWWIGHWAVYDQLLALDLRGMNILVPGCGIGDDVIRLEKLGARVTGFDVSPDLLKVAHKRATEYGASPHFDICPAERLPYPDASFDLVVFLDILHHVDIAPSMAEIRRVLRPGGRIVGCEIYTHSFAQRIRESWLVRDVLYRRMVRFVYGHDRPYITEDEHKIDEREFAMVVNGFTSLRCQYFSIAAGRLFPTTWVWLCRADRLLAKALAGAGRFLAGRVVFSATKVGGEQ